MTKQLLRAASARLFCAALYAAAFAAAGQLLSGCAALEPLLNIDLPAAVDPADPAEPTEGPADGAIPAAQTGDDLDLRDVAWDGLDIRGWPVTADLNASVAGGTVVLRHDKATVWPGANTTAGDGLNANAWVAAKVGGQWRAATWEWLRFGQQSKAAKSVAGDHVKKSAWPADWRPASGETVYLAVSGLCRDKTRNVAERSAFRRVVWP